MIMKDKQADMKKSVLLMASMLLTSHAFGHDLSNAELQKRHAKFQKMKTTGLKYDRHSMEVVLKVGF